MITAKVTSGNSGRTEFFGTEKKLLLMTIKRSLTQSSGSLKDSLRLRTASAGLGTKIGAAWRASVYPGEKSGDQTALAYSPASIVYSRATHIFLTHITGAVIGPKRQKYLVVPVKEVQDAWRMRGFTHEGGRLGQARGNARNAGQYAAISLREWEARNHDRLRTVWRRSAGGKIACLLVSDKDHKVKFLLMHSVTLPARLEINSAWQAVSANFPIRLQDDVRRVLDDLNNR